MGGRIRGADTALLQIGQFEESDAGTYTCSVEYNLPTSIRVGEGSIDVTAVSIVTIYGYTE